MYTLKTISCSLIFALVFSQCTNNTSKPVEVPKKVQEVDKNSLNYKISNELSEFSGSSFIAKKADDFLKQWNLAGMTMAIVKDGKLVFAHGYGYSDVEAKTVVTPGNLFRIASVSKLITAVAIMKLVEKKVISLDSKVFGPKAILKDSIFNKVVDKRLYNITVRHLLAHAGGWTLTYGDPAFNSLVVLEKTGETGAATMDSYCRFVATRKLHFEPGKRSSYSNMGYMFLSKVIEAASGKKYDDFVINDVLKPQGILDMHIGRSYLADKRINEVKYYEAEDSPMIPSFDGSGTMVPKPYGGNPIELLSSAGGWIASSVELAKLMVLIDGFRSVPDMISGHLIDQMVVHKDFKGPLGWKVVKKNGDWIRTGSMAGTSAIVKRQSNGFGWVIIINSSSWKGPRLPAYVDYMMRQIEKKITSWPKKDLFKYEPTKSLK
ncbi:beta-lactamase [Aquipluma nitroreducens]|uniref:Beta-lactamase n=1 Tax=Aquipluma nitroreducens TaxID=2010828 RepID=A0A5K7SH23_9BACT|nr:serine hydrolase domain-containing protein [Aquipluma nitroreducens]BBE20779.1 beta-lactamase [Aquipluma nitroreducens]